MRSVNKPDRTEILYLFDWPAVAAALPRGAPSGILPRRSKVYCYTYTEDKDGHIHSSTKHPTFQNLDKECHCLRYRSSTRSRSVKPGKGVEDPFSSLPELWHLMRELKPLGAFPGIPYKD